MYLSHHLEKKNVSSGKKPFVCYAEVSIPSHLADNVSQNTNDESGHISTYLFNKPYGVD